MQQADVLNNCAFHTVLQVGSVIHAIAERQGEGQSWQLGRLEGADVMGRVYGGKLEDVQQMRQDWQQRALDTCRPEPVLGVKRQSFGLGLRHTTKQAR
mmetsp:Transcript_5126/g.12927  ORF Transcript_5126/g.12927 Transcript_5126/m.12927 type:complete len:98 (+) Transcript_5126:347-640(+)